MIHSVVYKRLASENIYVETFGLRQAAARFSDVMWVMRQILLTGSQVAPRQH